MTGERTRPTSWGDGETSASVDGIMALKSLLRSPSVSSPADNPTDTDDSTPATGPDAGSRTRQPGSTAMEFTDITLPSGEVISGGTCEAIVSFGYGKGPTTNYQCTYPATSQCPSCDRLLCPSHTINHWVGYHTPGKAAPLYIPGD